MRQCSVREKKKNQENYTTLNQRNQNNQDLNIVIPVTGMEGDLNADTGTSKLETSDCMLK